MKRLTWFVASLMTIAVGGGCAGAEPDADAGGAACAGYAAYLEGRAERAAARAS